MSTKAKCGLGLRSLFPENNLESLDIFQKNRLEQRYSDFLTKQIQPLLTHHFYSDSLPQDRACLSCANVSSTTEPLPLVILLLTTSILSIFTFYLKLHRFVVNCSTSWRRSIVDVCSKI
jgi:hypothetical protein